MDGKIQLNRLLIEAAGNNNLSLLKRVVIEGADLKTQGNDAMKLACYKGYLNIVKYLVEMGVDIDANRGMPLQLACQYGFIDVVKYLLYKGADIHLKDDFALQIASEFGHENITRLLLEYGADIHANDDSAFREACAHGHLKIVELLLHYGANIHVHQDEALRMAAANGHAHIVKFLIDHDADFHLYNEKALELASQFGRKDVVALLLDNGADTKNNEAMILASKYGHPKIVRMLIEAGLKRDRNHRRSLTGQETKFEGTTIVSHDLLSKNKLVQILSKQSRKFIMSLKRPSVQKLFMDTITHYSQSFEYNALAMLQIFLDLNQDETDPMIEVQIELAKIIYSQFELYTIVNARIMAHITSNAMINEDLVVYRGMKPTLYKKHNFKYMLILELIEKLEQLQKQLHNPNDLDIILTDYVTPERVKDPEIVIQLIRDIERIERTYFSFNLEKLLYGKGEEITMETFFSTTLSIEHARKFMDKKDNCCLFAIKIPKGTPGFYITPFSKFKGVRSEYEIVLPPCSRFINTGNKDGVTYLTYLGPTPENIKRMTLTDDQLKQILDSRKNIMTRPLPTLPPFKFCKNNISSNGSSDSSLELTNFSQKSSYESLKDLKKPSYLEWMKTFFTL